jgi:Asp/Glu/hydantoin racemase
MKRIVLVNPNTNASTTALMVAIAREHLPEGFQIEGATAPFGAQLITDEDQLRVAAEAIVALAPTLADGIDGMIVSAFADPGVDTLRRLLSTPVAGIAECAMREAGAGGRRFSVVTTTPKLARAISSHADKLGLQRQLVSVRTTEGPLEALMADSVRLLAALKRASDLALKQDGAEAIIIGGGPLAAAAKRLRDQISAPIVEPIPAAVRWAHAILRVG